MRPAGSGTPGKNSLAAVTANGVDLVAYGDIGQDGEKANGGAGEITVTTGYLQAASTAGSIYLWSIGGVVAGKVPHVSSPFSFSAPKGVVKIKTSSPLEIAEDVIARGSILEQAGNSNDTQSNLATSQLTVDPHVTIQSTGSSIELDAGGGVMLLAGAQILAATTLALNAGYLDETPQPASLGALDEAPTSAEINIGNSGQSSTITLASGRWSSAYSVGQGVYLAATTGAAFTEKYYTITAINGDTLTVEGALTPETGAQAEVAPVTAAPTAAKVDFGNSGNMGTVTLAKGQSWGGAYAVGQGVFVGSASDPNGNGATFDASAANPYYVITAVDGATLTVQGLFTPETGAQVEVAPVTAANVTIDAGVALTAALQPNLGALNVAPVSAAVSFGNSGATSGTITLASGSWSSAYAVGQGVFIGSTSDPNANGQAFSPDNPNPYYTITAINGATLTVEGTLTAEAHATVEVAPVTAAPAGAQVNFGNSGGSGTITLTGGSWSDAYQVGQGVFIGSASDPNSNGATFSATNANPYYTITAIHGATLTVKGALTPENGADVEVAPVTIPVSTGAENKITINAENNAATSGSAALSAQSAQSTIAVNAGYLSAKGAFKGDASTIEAFGAFTASTLTIATGNAGSVIDFSPSALAANTFITAGGGENVVNLYNLPSLTTYASYVANSGAYQDTINVTGTGGGDDFTVDATVSTNYVVNINDTAVLGGAINNLTINGANTTSGQEVLVREGFVAILASNETPQYAGSNPVLVYQRINYDASITGRLTINGGMVTDTSGGNYFAMDGNSAVMTINAGNGAEWFQVGQQYDPSAFAVDATTGKPLSGDVGALFGDSLTTTLTTVGELSDGIDKATVLYGGAGTDTFQVYSNKADLAMIGGSGDDMFIVRAFLVAAGTHIGVKGGSGKDTIQYNINAPIDIEGGTGFNTLVVMGTEANDTFVVETTGIYGAGINVAYTNIQALVIDGMEGDDTFYVLGTPAGMVTTLDGGAGGDTFIVGGDVAGPVYSKSATGVTSPVNASVATNDDAYKNVFAPGVSVVVAGSGTYLINQPTQSALHVLDAASEPVIDQSNVAYYASIGLVTEYQVNEPTGLVGTGKTAYVNILPAQPSAEWGGQGAASLLVSTDGGKTWSSTGTLTFVDDKSGQQSVQKVLVRAGPATGQFTSNESIVVANAIVSADMPSLELADAPHREADSGGERLRPRHRPGRGDDDDRARRDELQLHAVAQQEAGAERDGHGRPDGDGPERRRPVGRRPQEFDGRPGDGVDVRRLELGHAADRCRVVEPDWRGAADPDQALDHDVGQP